MESFESDEKQLFALGIKKFFLLSLRVRVVFQTNSLPVVAKYLLNPLEALGKHAGKWKSFPRAHSIDAPNFQNVLSFTEQILPDSSIVIDDFRINPVCLAVNHSVPAERS